jgi:hypothetical protein
MRVAPIGPGWKRRGLPVFGKERWAGGMPETAPWFRTSTEMPNQPRVCGGWFFILTRIFLFESYFLWRVFVGANDGIFQGRIA